MDYKGKVIALLNSEELSKEQKEKLEAIFPELKEKESEDEDIKKELIAHFRNTRLVVGTSGNNVLRPKRLQHTQ